MVFASGILKPIIFASFAAKAYPYWLAAMTAKHCWFAVIAAKATLATMTANQQCWYSIDNWWIYSNFLSMESLNYLCRFLKLNTKIKKGTEINLLWKALKWVKNIFKSDNILSLMYKTEITNISRILKYIFCKSICKVIWNYRFRI